MLFVIEQDLNNLSICQKSGAKVLNEVWIVINFSIRGHDLCKQLSNTKRTQEEQVLEHLYKKI